MEKVALKLRTSQLRGEWPDTEYAYTPLPTEGEFYVVEAERLVGAVGYNRQGGNVTYELRVKCPRTNSSHEECPMGWLGTTDNVHRQALGRFRIVGHSTTHTHFEEATD